MSSPMYTNSLIKIAKVIATEIRLSNDLYAGKVSKEDIDEARAKIHASITIAPMIPKKEVEKTE